MAFYPFQLSKVPVEVIPEIRAALLIYDIETLTFIHNKYKVSSNHFCCPDPCVLPHFANLIQQFDDASN